MRPETVEVVEVDVPSSNVVQAVPPSAEYSMT